ncbi:unnamed protein product, partial [marine sediment metagenome]
YGRMQRLANSLESIGIKVGDRVGVLAWNTYQHFEIYFVFTNKIEKLFFAGENFKQ